MNEQMTFEDFITEVLTDHLDCEGYGSDEIEDIIEDMTNVRIEKVLTRNGYNLIEMYNTYLLDYASEVTEILEVVSEEVNFNIENFGSNINEIELVTTFESFKGRSITDGQKVKVYKNLHNGLWSIKDVKSGLVLGHAETVVLDDVTFKVSKSGRQRVIEDKKKNVHAYAVGYYNATESAGNVHEYTHDDVTYNPYKDTTFTLKSNRSYQLHDASKVVLNGYGVYADINL